MKKEKVYLESCHNYDLKIIEPILIDAIDYLHISIPESSKILLKPNILGAYPPEACINTHPVIVEGVIRLLLDKKNTIILGDSSGNGQYGNTLRALEKSGMTGLGKKYGISVNAFDKHTNRVFQNEENHIFKKINLTSYIDEVDFIINLPKLKSHTFLKYTGAVKNFYGCIPGAGKPYGHMKAPNQEDFSHGLLDIYSLIKDKILVNVIDGIIGIEGPGPGPGGKIKKAGFIGMSTCALSLDAVSLELLKAQPHTIHTHRLGIKRNLFSGKIEKNKTLTPVEFQLPKSNKLEFLVNRYMPSLTLSKPVADKTRCTRCGFCAKACPASAITLQGYPVFNYKKCIFCFCCHENCPEAAIFLKENIFFRIFKSMH